MEIIKKDFYFLEPFEELEEIKHVVVHHTSRSNMTAEDCHEFHQNDYGWSGIGYNFFIEKNGAIVEGRGFQVGAHALGHNRNSIGVCITGDFDAEFPTESQRDSFIKLCHYLIKKFNLDSEKIVGHRELDGVTKTCPGKNVNLIDMRKCVKEAVEGVGVSRPLL